MFYKLLLSVMLCIVSTTINAIVTEPSKDIQRLISSVERSVPVSLLNPDLSVTLLHKASIQASHSPSLLPLIKYLIENGGDINVQTKNGATPLYLFSRGGPMPANQPKSNIPVAKYLLENGADPNIAANQTRYGSFGNIDTMPLMYAAEKGNVELVTLLLEYGAQPNYRDANGCNAFCRLVHQAKKFGISNVSSSFLKTGDILVSHGGANYFIRAIQLFGFNPLKISLIISTSKLWILIFSALCIVLMLIVLQWAPRFKNDTFRPIRRDALIATSLVLIVFYIIEFYMLPYAGWGGGLLLLIGTGFSFILALLSYLFFRNMYSKNTRR